MQSDKIYIYILKIALFTSQGRFDEAINIGCIALSLIKYKMKKNPSMMSLMKELIGSKIMIGNKAINKLKDNQILKDERYLSIVKILYSMGPPALFSSSVTLLPVVIIKMLKISLKYGNTEYSGFAFGVYGMLSILALNDIETGYEFGKLAVDFVEKNNNPQQMCSVYQIMAYFINHWKKHIKINMGYYLKGIDKGIESGSLQYMTYCINMYLNYLFTMGKPLNDVLSEFDKYRNLVIKTKLINENEYFNAWNQFVFNLSDNNKQLLLKGDYFNEEIMLPIWIRQNNHACLVLYYLYKIITSYLFDNNKEVIKNANLAKKSIGGVGSAITIEEIVFYQSLAISDSILFNSKINGKKNIKLLYKNIKRLFKWSIHCEENFLHKYCLINAQKSAINNKDQEAMRLYDEAIASAHENGYVNIEAIANECAAKFYLSRELKTLASAYMQKARYCYQEWGAMAKVKQLDEKYGELLGIRAVKKAGGDDQMTGTMRTTTSVSTSSSSGSSPGTSSFLDVDTVMKATQAISGEIEMKNLLSKMIRILAENAGADKGALVLEEDGKLFVEAYTNKGKAEVLKHIPLERFDEAPEAVIRYTAKTSEAFVLDDAADKGSFVNDPYIKAGKVKSVLCLPVIKQGKLIGVLYLENNLAAGAFTPERVEMMGVLSAQAAINIENARLYGKLEDYSKNLEKKVAERTAELAEKNQIMLNDLKLASRVQERMLPDRSVLAKLTGCSVAGRYLAMEELGGDLYDVIRISDAKYGFMIADVSGHGVSASLVTAMAKVSFNANALLFKGTGEICGRVNSEICQLLGEKGEHDLTVFFGILDVSDGSFNYTCCAHQPAFLIRKNGPLEQLTTDDTSIGLEGDVKFSSGKKTLAKGERIVLYTDGIVEAMNPEGVQFDAERLAAATKVNADKTPEEYVDKVIEYVDAFCGHAKPHDDRAILCVDYTQEGKTGR
ncbi:MAG: GAF domain-containing protein [Spirochaetaceae bacterium]|nr:MAG: GAF domain-containing protein [Spirochaetaceae bacterium]